MNGIKKSTIERAKENGVIERMNVLLSAAYLLNSEISLIMARCESMLERNGLLLGRIKTLTNRLNVAFDQYCREFSSMILTDESKQGYYEDVSEFDDLFFAWNALPKEWHEGDKQYIDNPKDIIIKTNAPQEITDNLSNDEKDLNTESL